MKFKAPQWSFLSHHKLGWCEFILFYPNDVGSRYSDSVAPPSWHVRWAITVLSSLLPPPLQSLFTNNILTTTAAPLITGLADQSRYSQVQKNVLFLPSSHLFILRSIFFSLKILVDFLKMLAYPSYLIILGKHYTFLKTQVAINTFSKKCLQSSYI